MEYRMIKSPSAGTIEILRQRMVQTESIDLTRIGAIGLIQGRMIDMVCAADQAEKTANVLVRDVRGSCPQNMVLLALLGDTSSVEAALALIQQTAFDGNSVK